MRYLASDERLLRVRDVFVEKGIKETSLKELETKLKDPNIVVYLVNDHTGQKEDITDKIERLIESLRIKEKDNELLDKILATVLEEVEELDAEILKLKQENTRLKEEN